MLKGQIFSNQLYENQICALFNDTFLDGANGVSNNYKNGMAITYSGSDLTIDSGACVIQGRYLEEDTSTTISAGADNMYCKLVIEIDLDKTNTTTEFNQAYYKIVKGANDYPALTQTNIVKNVSGVYQYELARFRNPSSGITDFQDMRTFVDFSSIYDVIQNEIDALENESNLVFKTGSTMTGKLIAEGGIEGNVEGNLTGNSSTASQLQTARTIALTGAVSGSGSFNGSSNLSITTTQNNIAVITGNVTAPAYFQEHNGWADTTISYPSGYNANNSIVLSIGLQAQTASNGYNYGGAMGRTTIPSGGDTSYLTAGNSMDMGFRANTRSVLLRDSDIRIRIQNVADSTVTFYYKIVLMKIA